MIRLTLCFLMLAFPALAQDDREHMLDPENTPCPILHVVAEQPEALADDFRHMVSGFVLGASVGIDPDLPNPVAALIAAEMACRADPNLSLMQAMASAAKTLRK